VFFFSEEDLSRPTHTKLLSPARVDDRQRGLSLSRRRHAAVLLLLHSGASSTAREAIFAPPCSTSDLVTRRWPSTSAKTINVPASTHHHQGKESTHQHAWQRNRDRQFHQKNETEMGRLFSAGTGPSCNCAISNGAPLDRTPPFLRRKKEGERRRKRSEGKKKQGRREKNEKASCPAYQNSWSCR
jgi:hypothetical protein